MGKIVSYPVSVLIDQSEDADLGTTSNVPVQGYLVGLSIVAPDLDATDTYTVTLTDKNSATVFTRGTLAENTTTNIWSDSYGGTAEYQRLRTPMVSGGIDVAILASGDQAADRSFTVYIYYEV